EGLERYETLPGGLEGVVVGEVLTCEKHPNADKLRVCTVDIGGEEPSTIVCGAPNVAAGQKVVVATIGTILHPTEGEPFKIKKAKIRGQESRGMICAEDELGLGTDHDGIIVLDSAPANGTPARDVFSVEIDYVMEIGLTPNRVDAASHYGTARDVAALLRKDGVKARLPEMPAINDGIANPVSIELPEPDRCPRYVGIYIEGVEIKDSPDWMQHRLKSIGLRPINNVVDITNFVLHELGQPLHAFDADRIRGNKIVVKTLAEDTKFTTLDDQERTIRAGLDLMICDGEGPVAVAGVMGGQNSEVDAQTKNVFLESAYFSPQGIRRTASYMGLKTDASYRFERGVDPNNTLEVALRATALILELAGGKASVVVDERKAEHPPFEISFDLAHGRRVMGHDFTVEEMRGIL
ncbi:MAG: phenylalanine--tRNA ligase subunit beta, partial [Bacteroidota bacterium]